MFRLVAVLLLAAHAVGAQQAPGFAAKSPSRPSPGRIAELNRRRVDFVEADQLKTQNQWLIKHRSVGMPLLTSGDSQTQYMLLRRETSSEPEVHARWDDLVIVRAGIGAIVLGDSLTGSKYRAPGERAGGTIVNTHQVVIRTGDVIRIPAAVPHAFLVTTATPLEYILIKQRRQELPIRWYGDTQNNGTSSEGAKRGSERP